MITEVYHFTQMHEKNVVYGIVGIFKENKFLDSTKTIFQQLILIKKNNVFRTKKKF